MMAQGRGNWWGKAGGDRTRSLGLVLAILALLSQSLVMLLPVPAMAMAMPMNMPGMDMSALPADAALFQGGYILCQDEDAAPAPDADSKAPCQHCVDCPVCQVFHAAGGLIPPTVPALPRPTLVPVAFMHVTLTGQPLPLVAQAHQPRAPPSIVRF